jgi:hypothetical protein
VTKVARGSRGTSRVVAAVLVAAMLVAVAVLIVRYPALAYEISQEDGLLEVVQVILVSLTALVALSSVLALYRSGRPHVLDAVIAAAMAALVIGEIDLDRRLFGVKIIHTRFFVNAEIPLAMRALAAVVILGAPAALGAWVVRRWRTLWDATVTALREPWGQVFAAGAAVFVLVELVEKPLSRLLFAPRNSLEETVELAASIAFFVAVVARRGGLRDDRRGAGGPQP